MLFGAHPEILVDDGTRIKPTTDGRYLSVFDSTGADSIDIYHNGTDGYIESKVGDLSFISAGGEVNVRDGGKYRALDSGNTQSLMIYQTASEGIIETDGDIRMVADGSDFQFRGNSGGTASVFQFYQGSQESMRFRFDGAKDQFTFTVPDACGNQIVFADHDHNNKDFDHAPTTHPTLFIHSNTNPDTNNTQYLSIYHDGADSYIESGLGFLRLKPASGVQMSECLSVPNWEGGYCFELDSASNLKVHFRTGSTNYTKNIALT